MRLVRFRAPNIHSGLMYSELCQRGRPNKLILFAMIDKAL